MERRTYLTLLAVLFVLWSIWLAIEPYNRADWALENALVVVAVVLIVATYRPVPLSRISYTLIFLFLCLHEIGAHFTYAETPYDRWFQEWLGFSLDELLGFERNHFDRLAHFVFGLFLAYPVREVLLRLTPVRGMAGYVLPWIVMVAMSSGYELIEWGAAVAFGGDLGIAYLGTQGDEWDAHKDIFLAIAGASIALVVTAMVNTYLKRDYASEWNASLKRPGSGSDLPC